MDQETFVEVDMSSRAFLEDPYPTYGRMREKCPIHVTADGDWFVTRYQDVSKILSDSDSFRRESPGYANPFSYERRKQLAIERMIGQWMVFLDPPLHMRLRRRARDRFLPPAIEAQRPLIREVAEQLVDAVLSSGKMEVMQDIAYPLPMIVVSRILGVPAADHALFHDATQRMTRALDRGTEAEMMAADEAGQWIADYFSHLVAERRRTPRDDLISDLIRNESQEDHLSEEQIVATSVFLLWGGHETTKNLIGNGLLALMRSPDQMTALRRNPNSASWAVEEMLRYDSPIQKLCRWTREEVRLSTGTIPGGRLVVAVLAAAHRDPSRFPDPDRFDIARPPGRHLAFGLGRHHCLGSTLARIEAQEVFKVIVHRLTDLEYDSQGLVWQDTTSIRGPSSLPVRFVAVESGGTENAAP